MPEYQQTAALWARGVLQHEFGVAPKDMEFWMERTPDRSHGGATGFKPPPGVVVHRIPADKSIGSMMLAGELDAVLHYLSGRNLVDRSRADLTNHPDFKFLFPDPIAEGIRFYRKTGLLPINHQTVVRRDVFEKEPWVALNLIKAFNKANEIANERRVEHVADHLAAGLLSGDAKTPLIHHGVKANRKVIETIAQYSLEQALTPRLDQDRGTVRSERAGDVTAGRPARPFVRPSCGGMTSVVVSGTVGMARITGLWQRLRALVGHHRGQVALSIRTTIAALAALVLAQLLQLPLPLWAVLTAVIVTQLSVGRSLKATFDYLVGTVGGAIYGGAIGVLIPYSNEMALLLGLAIAVAPLALGRRDQSSLFRRADYRHHRGLDSDDDARDRALFGGGPHYRGRAGGLHRLLRFIPAVARKRPPFDRGRGRPHARTDGAGAERAARGLASKGSMSMRCTAFRTASARRWGN